MTEKKVQAAQDSVKLSGDNTVEHILDAKGLFCPEPVMLLHKKIREMESNEILRLTATDPSTARDVAKFCHFLGHELISSSDDGKVFHYCIRKA